MDNSTVTTSFLHLPIAQRSPRIRPQAALGAAQAACGAQGSTAWFPDLRRDEQFIDLDILVKF
jgi:hypothetical protein